MRDETLVIVGASYAGLQLASSVRDLGFDGRICMVGEEPDYPYQRPPLSKGILTGKVTEDKLPLRSDGFYALNKIEVTLGARVTGMDVNARSIRLNNEQQLDYDWLALTTGARCRPLPVDGAHLENVLTLRTRHDARRIAQIAKDAKAACVIGGGFIGLEVASALQANGLQVTVVESLPRLLARNFPEIMSDYIVRSHRRHSVQVELGSTVRRLQGKGSHVVAVELADGRKISCDLVVVGIGVLPNDDIAREAGIATDNGILVDAYGRTTVDRVLAAGDVANMLLPSWGPQDTEGRYRFESIQAANDGARACASVIAGQPVAMTAVPWFWSDQFNLKFQMAGLSKPSDQIVVRGNIDADRFSLFYLRHGRVAAVHTVNRPAEHMLSRRLIAAGVPLTASQAADEAFDLKSLVPVTQTNGRATTV